MLIKNKKFLKKETLVDGKTTYVIKSTKSSGEKVYFNDVFNHLPCGIIDKTATGIGGTSCELDATRDSIVVQPYNITAYSKGKNLSQTNKYSIHYYGNYQRSSKKAVSKSKKISTKNITLNDKLASYIKKCNSKKQPIKITCITDQLEPLKNFLDSFPDKKFDKYHLVLDEIDSLQEQSDFREVMDKCFHIYKKHPEENRSVISATIIEFNDEVMKKEPYSIIAYDKTIKNDITLIGTKKIEDEIVKQIIHLTKTSTQKILIACNNLDYCIKVITAIKKEATVKKRKSKILCSVLKKKQVGKYYAEMNVNGSLPGDINFITAAYFNGYDINEQYHSIIVANRLQSNLRLSPSLIYQISGRGRKGLLSNKLLLKIEKDTKYEYYNIDQLIGNTEELRDVNDFIKKLKKSRNPLTVKTAEAINNIYFSGSGEIPPLYTKDDAGQIIPSFFKIDNRLEQQKTHKIYGSFKSFKKVLSKKFNVLDEKPLHTTETELKLKHEEVKVLVKDLLKQLSKINRTIDYTEAINLIRNGLLPKYYFQTIICNIYEYACRDESIDLNKIISLIESNLIKERTFLYQLKCIRLHLNFLFHCYKIEKIKLLLKSTFNLNIESTNPDLKEKLKNFAELFDQLTKTNNKEIRAISKEISMNHNMVSDSLLNIQKKRTAKKYLFTVVDYYPFDLSTDSKTLQL